MAFDPDAYLAEKTKKTDDSSSGGGFDPDAYLAEKASKSPEDMHSTEEVSPAVLARIPQPVSTPQNVAPAQQTAPPAAPGGVPGQAPPKAGQPPMPTPEKPLGGAPGLPEPKKRPTLSEPEDLKQTLAKGTLGLAIPDIAASQAAGLGGSIVGGVVGTLAGAGRAMYGMATGEGFKGGLEAGAKKGADVLGSIQGAMYQPHTDEGKAVSKAVGEISDDANKKLGEGAAYVAKSGALGIPISEEAARTVGENLIPMAGAVAGGKSMFDTAKAFQAREKTPVPTGKDFTPKEEKPVDPGSSAAALTEKPAEIKEGSYSPTRELTEKQTKRYKLMKSQGIEPTLGQITRDPAQYQYETQLAKTEGGKQLRQRELETNAALIKAVEDIDTKRAGKKLTENARDTGHSLSTAIERSQQESLSNASDLYTIAKESGETKAKVDTKPLKQYLKENKAMGKAVPALDAIGSKLAELEKDAKKTGGMTVDDYEILYRAAGDLAGADDSAAHFMGKIKGQINSATEGVGGDLYRKARLARVKHSLEFDDRSAIARLWEKKPGSRTDYKTSNEEAFHKTVVSSSLEELKDVTRSLKAANRPDSLQAMRNIQGQTFDFVLGKEKEGISLNAMDQAEFSPAAVRGRLNQIGKDKLNHLIGEEATKELYEIVKSARYAKTVPGKVAGSDTAQILAIRAERAARDASAKYLMSQVPGVSGKAISAITDYFKNKKGVEAIKASTKEALNPVMAAPETIAAGAKKANKENRAFAMGTAKQMSKDIAPAAALTTTMSQQRIAKPKEQEEEDRLKKERHEKRLEAIRMEDAR